MEVWIVLCTLPDMEKARQIATILVESQLVACVNLLPSIQSVYRWEGKVESAQEVLAVMKVTMDGYEKLEARLRELHPYELPEILAIPVAKGLPAYLNWVVESVGKE